MRYYIIKPKRQKIDDAILCGIRENDSDMTVVSTLLDADICVLQKGWTRSKICIAEYHMAKEKGICIREAYLYTDRCSAAPNVLLENTNCIITDPKGMFFSQYTRYMENNGYDIKKLNLNEIHDS